MENYFSTAVIWFVIGFLFFILEFAVPGFILFFFGLGSWVVAILALFLDISINIQILLFLGSSLITVALFRNWVKEKIGSTKLSKYVLEDELIGKTAVAETPILPDQQGKVNFRGTSWNASSTVTINKGEPVTITGNESILLFVKPSKSL